MHLKHALLSLFVIALILVAIADQGYALNVPERIDYQGLLVRNGNPVTTEVEVIFRIYDDETGGTLLWDETQMVTPDPEGRFNVELGVVDRLNESVFDGSGHWMSMEIERGGETSPRVHFTSVPYAYHVQTIDGAAGGSLTGNTTVQGDLQVNGDAILPASSVSSDEISNEAGIEYSTVSLRFLPDTDTTIAFCTVSCPSDGYVFAMASARVTMIQASGAVLTCKFGISSTPNSMPADQAQSIRLSSSSGGGTWHFPVTAQAAFPVSAGLNTFYFIGRVDVGTPDIQSVSSVNMAAMFFPTHY